MPKGSFEKHITHFEKIIEKHGTKHTVQELHAGKNVSKVYAEYEETLNHFLETLREIKDVTKFNFLLLEKFGKKVTGIQIEAHLRNLHFLKETWRNYEGNKIMQKQCETSIRETYTRFLHAFSEKIYCDHLGQDIRKLQLFIDSYKLDGIDTPLLTQELMEVKDAKIEPAKLKQDLVDFLNLQLDQASGKVLKRQTPDEMQENFIRFIDQIHQSGS